MAISRRRLALLLALTPGIGGKTLVKVLTRMDLLGVDPQTFVGLSESDLRSQFGLSARAASRFTAEQSALLQHVADVESRLEQHGVGLLTSADASYPERLAAFDPDPPPALFCYGNAKLLRNRTFSVLSSRRTSPAGLNQIEQLAEAGVLAGETLVAGHDRPEYQRAAVVPLRWGAPRVICLDRGLFQALGEDLSQEPFRAARLWRYRFDPLTDLALSPCRPELGFAGLNNQVRDRLIASLSDRLDFVEVNPSGNMERLVRQGLAAGRRVRVSDRSIGHRSLREAGAEAIEA